MDIFIEVMNGVMSENFIANYKAKHQHPLNKLSHSIGIPMIVVSLPLFFFNWRWALVLFIVGWILQFVGHAIEGNQPAFFRNPVYLLIGPLWLLRRAVVRRWSRQAKRVEVKIPHR